MESHRTWCFITSFVCRYHDLPLAKPRHQRCVDVLREDYTVHFSSEQAYIAGHNEPSFTHMISQIIGSDQEITPEVKENFACFYFATFVDVPYDPDTGKDDAWKICIRLNIDFESEPPARFPSQTKGIIVSETGRELKGCTWQ